MQVLKNAETRMDKSIEKLKRDLSTLRTGRASASLVENIKVDYWGTPTPIPHVGQVTVPEATQLVIKPYEKPLLKDIERAIHEANIGLNPNNDGEVIRINVPAPTEERRKELAKNVKSFADDAKVAIRNVRRDANDELKKMQKSSDITEDELKSLQDDVQKLTDKKIKEVDAVAASKEKDIMSQ
ncbi:MAG: ribosome recycling factor [Turicibacter sp.]|nr:ribosome recycling factor [Turicibacter sp.]